MNPQLTTLFLIAGGTGIATLSAFAALHATFKRALVQTDSAPTVDGSSTYFGRIY